MPIKGVFFDLGGTLFSYRHIARTNIPILIESVKHLGGNADAEQIKRVYAQASSDVSERYAETPYYLHRDLFAAMFIRFCELLEMPPSDEVRDWYLDSQREAMIKCLEIKHDCVDTLMQLKNSGLYLSIVSNIDDDMLEPLVARENLDRMFDHWTSSESAGSCKPHHGFFTHALERAALVASDVLFVGDSPEHDIVGAKALGMQTALIIEAGIEPPLQTGRGGADADHTIHALGELPDIVASAA